jgi:hypothetical protein
MFEGGSPKLHLTGRTKRCWTNGDTSSPSLILQPCRWTVWTKETRVNIGAVWTSGYPPPATPRSIWPSLVSTKITFIHIELETVMILSWVALVYSVLFFLVSPLFISVTVIKICSAKRWTWWSLDEPQDFTPQPFRITYCSAHARTAFQELNFLSSWVDLLSLCCLRG